MSLSLYVPRHFQHAGSQKPRFCRWGYAVSSVSSDKHPLSRAPSSRRYDFFAWQKVPLTHLSPLRCILGCRGTYTGLTSFREHPREKGEIFSPFQSAVPQTPWNLTCAMELRHWFTAPICFSKHSAVIHFFFILASNIFLLRLWEIIL